MADDDAAYPYHSGGPKTVVALCRLDQPLVGQPVEHYMQRWQNLLGVLKKKTRIYVWLLVGFVPAWAYGLTANLTAPQRLLNGLCLLLADVALVTSFWIVVWRWEAIEQRRLPKRVRALLLTLSGFMILFFAVFSFEALAALGGLLVPWSE